MGRGSVRACVPTRKRGNDETTAVANLRAEGFPFTTPNGTKQRVADVGDVMYDAVLFYRDRARREISLDRWGLAEDGYALCTLHRQENTDDPTRLASIFAALQEIKVQFLVRSS